MDAKIGLPYPHPTPPHLTYHLAQPTASHTPSSLHLPDLNYHHTTAWPLLAFGTPNAPQDLPLGQLVL